MSLPISETFAPLLAVNKAASSLAGDAGFISFFTNSVVVAVVVLGIILFMSKKATTGMSLIPHSWQNFFEAIVEFLYGRVESIVGPKVAPKAFPLLATLFVYILVSNWFGLIPGVGTIGFGPGIGTLSVDGSSHDFVQLLRPPTSDLNGTLALACCSFLVWAFLTVKETGVWGFIVHTFGPKGGLKGIMGMVVALVFLFVGVIEVVSIALRPMTLSIRLFGNVYAGEAVLHTLGSLADKAHPAIAFLSSILIPFPFYFMELLVGLLQAVVFTLLSAVYIQLSTTHDDHGEEHGHDEHH